MKQIHLIRNSGKPKPNIMCIFTNFSYCLVLFRAHFTNIVSEQSNYGTIYVLQGISVPECRFSQRRIFKIRWSYVTGAESMQRNSIINSPENLPNLWDLGIYRGKNFVKIMKSCCGLPFKKILRYRRAMCILSFREDHHAYPLVERSSRS